MNSLAANSAPQKLAQSICVFQKLGSQKRRKKDYYTASRRESQKVGVKTSGGSRNKAARPRAPILEGPMYPN
jgi:hypothetical protein